MIRKTVIVALSVGAMVAACLLVVSWAHPTRWMGRDNPWVPGVYGSVDLAHGELGVVLVRHDYVSPKLPWLAVAIVFAHTNWRSKPLDPDSPRLQSDAFKQVNSIRLPLWLGMIMLAAYPTLVYIRGPARHRRRRRKGLCLKCGYNLTGNISGVCPECGTAVQATGRGASPQLAQSGKTVDMNT